MPDRRFSKSRSVHPIVWMAIGGGLIGAAVWVHDLLGPSGHGDRWPPPTASQPASGDAQPPKSISQAGDRAARPKTDFDVDEFFLAKGLRRHDSFFVLGEESGFDTELDELARLKRDVDATQREESRAEDATAEKKAAIADCRARRRALEEQLTRSLPPFTYNQIVLEHNRLSDKEKQLEQDLADDRQLKSAEAAAGNAREAFVGQLLKLRARANRLQQQYAKLAADPEVGEMIAAYNKRLDKHATLGPSAALTDSLPTLEKFEKTTLIDAIDLVRGGGQVWQVPVVINNRDPQMMLVDTGASLVSLPYITAVALGLKPSESDPTLRMHIADGRVIEAKKVVARTIRVGKFEVHNVEVVVMPRTLADAPLLLGQSFFRHFTYKLDPETSKLTMTKIGGTPEAAATSEVQGRP